MSFNFNKNTPYSNPLGQTYSGSFGSNEMPPVQRGGVGDSDDYVPIADNIQYGGELNKLMAQYGGGVPLSADDQQTIDAIIRGGGLKSDIINFLKKRKRIFEQRRAFAKKNLNFIISRKNALNKKARENLKRKFFGSRSLQQNTIRGMRGRSTGRDVMEGNNDAMMFSMQAKKSIARSRSRRQQIAGSVSRRKRHARSHNKSRKQRGGSTTNYAVGGVLSAQDSALANGNRVPYPACMPHKY
jgi:hypothetical protein